MCACACACACACVCVRTCACACVGVRLFCRVRFGTARVGSVPFPFPFLRSYSHSYSRTSFPFAPSSRLCAYPRTLLHLHTRPSALSLAYSPLVYSRSCTDSSRVSAPRPSPASLGYLYTCRCGGVRLGSGRLGLACTTHASQRSI